MCVQCKRSANERRRSVFQRRSKQFVYLRTVYTVVHKNDCFIRSTTRLIRRGFTLGREAVAPRPKLGLAPKLDTKHYLTDSNRCERERCVALKIRQNAFPAGAPPWTQLRKLTTLPKTHQSAGEWTPLPIPHPTWRLDSGDVPQYLSLEPGMSMIYHTDRLVLDIQSSAGSLFLSRN